MAKKQTNGNLALEQQSVIVIPAHDEIVARKLRVAAYARVSSSSEDQLNSYRVQNQYYSELISSNPDWEMVDIYADEGITGTSVEKREDFQRIEGTASTITEWNENAVRQIVERVTVLSADEVLVRIKGGAEIRQRLER